MTWNIENAADVAKAERALREALDRMAHVEEDQITVPLEALDEDARAFALGLATEVTGYVMVDACNSQWPNQASVRRIANAVATTGSAAKRLRLDAEQIHAYLSRVVLGPERMHEVIPDEPQFTRLPVIVAMQALAVYCPEEIDIWDYLDQIEGALGVAMSLNPAVLPAAVMLAYLLKPTAGEAPSR
jgi:hypothetical protein